MRTMILASLWMLVSAWPVHAQVQSKDAQACINKLNQDGAATALQQGKESLACLTAAGKGKLAGTAAACLTADAKGKVAAKRQKTADDAAAKCTTASTPFSRMVALLVSGPSKTADIQVTLAYGAHGPKELVVLLLDGEDAR